MAHYYKPDGTAAHFLGAGGSPTTLREARKHGLVPSVTEVLGILAKKQLEEWKRKQTLMAACRLSDTDRDRLLHLAEMIDNDEEPDDRERAWFKAIWKQVEQEASKIATEAAAEGNAIHSAIEAMFAGERVPERYRPHCQGVRRMLDDNFNGVSDWVIERSYASPLGFAGKIDLHSPSIATVGDHKGVAVGPDEDKKLDWDQHYQLGGYTELLRLPDECRGFNLFISRTHPGHVRFHEWAPEKMAQGRDVFINTLRTWQSIKGYRPC